MANQPHLRAVASLAVVLLSACCSTEPAGGGLLHGLAPGDAVPPSSPLAQALQADLRWTTSVPATFVSLRKHQDVSYGLLDLGDADLGLLWDREQGGLQGLRLPRGQAVEGLDFFAGEADVIVLESGAPVGPGLSVKSLVCVLPGHGVQYLPGTSYSEPSRATEEAWYVEVTRVAWDGLALTVSYETGEGVASASASRAGFTYSGDRKVLDWLKSASLGGDFEWFTVDLRLFR
jgi:hypothetical protein